MDPLRQLAARLADVAAHLVARKKRDPPVSTRPPRWALEALANADAGGLPEEATRNARAVLQEWMVDDEVRDEYDRGSRG